MDEAIRYNELVREIFNVSRKDMLSHKEIADLLGIPESTVRGQIKRAIKQLRTAIKHNPYLLPLTMQHLR